MQWENYLRFAKETKLIFVVNQREAVLHLQFSRKQTDKHTRISLFVPNCKITYHEALMRIAFTRLPALAQQFQHTAFVNPITKSIKKKHNTRYTLHVYSRLLTSTHVKIKTLPSFFVNYLL